MVNDKSRADAATGATRPPHLCSALVCALNVEVQQEVGIGDPGAVGAELGPARRVGLRVNTAAGQVIVRDLVMTGIRGITGRHHFRSRTHRHIQAGLTSVAGVGSSAPAGDPPKKSLNTVQATLEIVHERARARF